MDALLADLTAIEADFDAEVADTSYHSPWEEVSRVRANRQWIRVYVRRAQKERERFNDLNAFARRLLELIDEVTADGDYDPKPMSAVGRVKRRLGALLDGESSSPRSYGSPGK